MSDFLPGYDAWKTREPDDGEDECICHRTPGGRRSISYKCPVHGEGFDPDAAMEAKRDDAEFFGKFDDRGDDE
jgi:hypothetical protein